MPASNGLRASGKQQDLRSFQGKWGARHKGGKGDLQRCCHVVREVLTECRGEGLVVQGIEGAEAAWPLSSAATFVLSRGEKGTQEVSWAEWIERVKAVVLQRLQHWGWWPQVSTSWTLPPAGSKRPLQQKCQEGLERQACSCPDSGGMVLPALGRALLKVGSSVDFWVLLLGRFCKSEVIY